MKATAASSGGHRIELALRNDKSVAPSLFIQKISAEGYLLASHGLPISSQRMRIFITGGDRGVDDVPRMIRGCLFGLRRGLKDLRLAKR